MRRSIPYLGLHKRQPNGKQVNTLLAAQIFSAIDATNKSNEQIEQEFYQKWFAFSEDERLIDQVESYVEYDKDIDISAVVIHKFKVIDRK